MPRCSRRTIQGQKLAKSFRAQCAYFQDVRPSRKTHVATIMQMAMGEDMPNAKLNACAGHSDDPQIHAAT